MTLSPRLQQVYDRMENSMKPQHTPGPWRFTNEPYDNGDPYITMYAGQGTFSNGFSFTGIIPVMDANLIAAAPDMLSELLRMQDKLASALSDGVNHFDAEMLQKWFNGVTATINKARRQS